MSWRRFLRRAYWDDERRRELESYLDIETDENIARGMSPQEARRAACRRLGNPTLRREEIYRMNSLGFVETVWQDLRYGARLLWLNPAFSLVALLSLSLGVGANTAVFQLIDAVRLRPLPVEEAHALVEVRIPDRRGSSGSFRGRRPMFTNPLWERIRDTQQVLSAVGAWGTTSFDLAQGGQVRYAEGLYVSGGFFEAMGVRPAAGRLFTPADDRRGCGALVAVLSHAFWQAEYGGDPGAIGRSIRLDGHAFEIVGVTARRFFGADVGRGFDVAVPLCTEPVVRGASSVMNQPAGWFLAAIGRLKPGVGVDEAAAHLRALAPAAFRETLPAIYSEEEAKIYLARSLTAVPAASGVSSIRGVYETPLWILLATTGLVLLIACANLANLMLARATTREREIAVRLAIGASRRRLVRQLMSESLLLAAAGAACGVLLAHWMSGFLVSFLDSSSDSVFLALQRDWRMLAFASTLALVTCLLFGLAPALRATHAAPAAVMKTGSRGLTDGRERFGIRRALVVAQVALSLVLMVGALLFVRTLANLRSADLGFDPRDLVVASLDLRRAQIPPDRRLAAAADLEDRVRRASGVAGVAQAAIVPVSGSGWNNNILVEGKVQETYPNFNSVSPGYFETLRTGLVAGRDFSAADGAGGARVAIVNESFARKYFAGRSPLGLTFQIQEPPGAPRPEYQVVGVVQDTKYTDVREPLGPIGYFPAAQDPDPGPFVQLIVRTRGSLPQAQAAIVEAIAQANPAIGLQLDPMETQIAETLLPERLMATLSGFFGGLAALIATIGLYGVMSYMVTRRRNEIGIRMALGANPASVVAMVMRESVRLVAAGTVAGAVLAVVAGRWASALLFELEPGDPATLAMSIAALGVVAVVASYLPAHRAARVDPTIALRGD